MDLVELVEEAMCDSAQILSTGEVTREEGWLQLTSEGWGDYRNAVVMCREEESRIDERIRRTIDHYAQRGLSFRWQMLPSNRPADLTDRLLAHGFKHDSVMRGMVLFGDAKLPPPAPKVRVDPLTPADIDTMIAILADGGGPPNRPDPDLVRAEFSRTIARTDGLVCHFIARYDGEPAGACTLGVVSRSGLLLGAVVLKTHQRRGIYREMIRARMAVLRDLGRTVVTVHCNPDTSAPICARIGFQHACDWDVLRWRNAGGADSNC